MTTLTTGHAGASGPRHPVSHTGPYDTTGRGERGIMSGGEGGRRKQRAKCHKSVKNIQTFQQTLPFIFFMMTVCQTIEGVCEISLSGLTAVKKVVVQSWLHTHNLSVKLQLCCFLDSLYLELSSARINRAKPSTAEMWKNCLIPDRIFSYSDIIHLPLFCTVIFAFHVALYCI